MSKFHHVLQTTSLYSRIIAIIFCAMGMTYMLGKDVNWDLINYHYYIAYAWQHDKFATDLFAAGPTSYLNPYGYLPYYWMVDAGWHSLAIGLTLAAIHSISLILLWELGEKILFAGTESPKKLAGLSVFLGAITPVYLGLLGGTFLEPMLAPLIFAALLVAALGVRHPSAGAGIAHFLFVGCVMGVATGLKLTSIVFAAALGLTLLTLACFGRIRFGPIWRYSLGLAVGYLLANGWWAWTLYQEFGNPLFPFFNEIFRSPDFDISKLDHDRFKVHGLVDLLLLPFRMAQFHSWTYFERLAPDIRPALLFIISGLLALRYILFKLKTRSAAIRWSDFQITTPQATAILFFGYSCILWLWTTGNGRYGLPVLMLIGPLGVFAMLRLGLRTRTIVLASLAVLAAQGFQQFHAWPPRWDSTPWTTRWFEPTVPDALKNRAYAYLSLGHSRSNSIAAPFLHPQSAFLSLAGSTYTFSPDAPSSRRIHEFINKHQGHLRTLIDTERGRKSLDAHEFAPQNMRLAPWKLRIDGTDCQFIGITLEYASAQEERRQRLEMTRISERRADMNLISCAIIPGPGEDEITAAERRALTPVFDKIEAACPLLFSPRGWYLSKYPSGWQRTYLQSDTVVYARQGRLSASRYEYGPFDVDMGAIEDWAAGKQKFECKRFDRPW